jgi:hypothetical protein
MVGESQLPDLIRGGRADSDRASFTATSESDYGIIRKVI